MLEIKNLTSGYGEFEVLKDVNLKVKGGEIVSLIGPNGAGKSTVIRSIFNLADVKKGSIVFKERDITNFKTHELMGLGISYVNQGRVIFNNLTVRENLEIGAGSIRDRRLIKVNLGRIYEKFPILEERKNKLAYGLSGGERQMLAIGRALMQNPSLLLLDEPSLGLSPILQRELFKSIEKLRDDGISILIVEQNAKRAIEISDRTYLLEDGKIVLSGRKNIIKNRKIKNVYLGGRY